MQPLRKYWFHRGLYYCFLQKKEKRDSTSFSRSAWCRETAPQRFPNTTQNPPYDSPALSRLGSSVTSTRSTPTEKKFLFFYRPILISNKALFLICFSFLAFFISEGDPRESSLANSVEFWHMAMLFPAKHAKWNFNLIFYFSRLSTCCRRACIGHLIYQIWWQTANKGLLGFYSVDLAVLLVAVLNWLGDTKGLFQKRC